MSSPAASSRSQIAGTSSIRIQWYWMFSRSVTSAVSRAKSLADLAERAHASAASSSAPSERTRIMKYSSSSSSSSSIAVLPPSKPGRALGVEAHPAEPAAQVGGVDRVEAALGVDVEDPVPDVERVVVLLGLLVLVQRLAVAERPLALAALGARDLGVRRRSAPWKRRSGMGSWSLRWRRRALTSSDDARLRRGWLAEAWSARPTDHAAGTPEVHVASYHEVRVRRSGDHVKESQGSDGCPTNANLMM